MLKTLCPLTFFFVFNSLLWAAAEPPKPKYGPEATPLSASHEYFQGHLAPGFWHLIPYYISQQDGSACSLASVTMLVNAARVGMHLQASDKLATQQDLLKKVKNSAWHRHKLLGVVMGMGVTLDQLEPLIQESLKAYGVTPLRVEVVHTENLSAETKNKLHQALVETENSGHKFILANFIQGVYTGDADVGHIAPLGAYDADKKRVLVLDPDREWYEPYWVSEETLLKGMATPDKQSGHNRGYVVISLPEHQ